MKRYLFILLGLIMMLGACGSNDNQTDDGNFNEEAFDEEFGDELEDLYEDEEVELDNDMTDDVKEIMSSDSEYDTFVAEGDLEGYIFNIEERYTSEESDDEGINNVNLMDTEQVDDETFDYSFSVMMAKNEEDNQNYLLFVGDVVNNTSKRVQFNHNFDVIMRDLKIEDDTYSGESEYDGLVGALEPEFDAEGWYALAVDTDEAPEELEVKFERAWDDDEGGSSGEEEFMEMEFNIE